MVKSGRGNDWALGDRMPYRDMLVHVDSSAASAERLEVATRLARSFDAHLIGLYVAALAPIHQYAEADFGPDLVEAHDRYIDEAADEAERRRGECDHYVDQHLADFTETLESVLDAVGRHRHQLRVGGAVRHDADQRGYDTGYDQRYEHGAGQQRWDERVGA